jgi:hypothetical protein
MALMHDTALRFDDMRKGQLGEILHSPDVTVVEINHRRTPGFCAATSLSSLGL